MRSIIAQISSHVRTKSTLVHGYIFRMVAEVSIPGMYLHSGERAMGTGMLFSFWTDALINRSQLILERTMNTFMECTRSAFADLTQMFSQTLRVFVADFTNRTLQKPITIQS